MSRVGKQEIKLDAKVKVSVGVGSVQVEGPKGKVDVVVPPEINVEQADDVLRAVRGSDDKRSRAMHGLTRALLANAVKGVTDGFSKELDVVGIGFRAEVKGKRLNMSLGFSHPIEFPVPEGIELRVEKNQRTISNYVATIVVTGIDKQQVGQVASDIRSLRPPDAYKGKGVRYVGESVRLKVGKKGA